MSDLPESFGKYHVLGLAGRGNMGTVYLGYDPTANRDVAIKVQSAPPDNDDVSKRVARKLFFNEAQMAGVLDHPNILKILDTGEEHGVPYIVMEYVHGSRTFLPHCEPDNLLPIARIGEVAIKCARALDYAHRRGIVHRDIKPTNLMLTPDGDVKIGDFGIAHRALDDTTHVLGLLGSPRYMSPEQVREEEITGQSDLYSLGVCVFELLTGRLPFTAPGLSRLIHQIITEEPPRLTDLRPDLPAGLDEVVRRALAKEPAERHRTGEELAGELARVFGMALPAGAAVTDQETRFQAVRQLAFFDAFSDSEVWETLHASQWSTHEPGETIVSEGNVDFSFYILVCGEATVTREGRRLTHLGAGDCFGEAGYLSHVRRSTSTEATTGVSLMRLNERNMEFASPACQLRFHKAFVRTLIERLARATGEDSMVDEPLPLPPAGDVSLQAGLARQA